MGALSNAFQILKGGLAFIVHVTGVVEQPNYPWRRLCRRTATLEKEAIKDL